MYKISLMVVYRIHPDENNGPFTFLHLFIHVRSILFGNIETSVEIRHIADYFNSDHCLEHSFNSKNFLDGSSIVLIESKNSEEHVSSLVGFVETTSIPCFIIVFPIQSFSLKVPTMRHKRSWFPVR